MKIILKYIFTNVKERKVRTAVMLLSILMSTTLLIVSFSIGASYESAQRKMARGMAGSATVSVTAADGAVAPGELPSLPLVGASVGILRGRALYHEDGYYETIDLIAADLEQLGQINPPRMADGGEIPDFSGSQVILPDRFTSKYGISRGDTIALEIDGNTVQLQVAGIAAYDTVFLRHTRGATALLPLSTLGGLLGREGGYSEILVKPADGISTEDLKHELVAALPDGDYQVAEVVNEGAIEADARQKSMPFFLISFFALTMSVFIIYSSYKVITLDRLPVIGTFRSIGATQKDVTRMLVLESAVYGGLGGLTGIPVGIVVLKLILHGMGRSLSQGIEIPVVITPFSVIFSAAVAMLVSLLSSWLPAHRAGRLPIKDVVLGMVEERTVPRCFTVSIGLALLALAVILPRIAGGKLLYLAGGFSLLGLIAAAVLMVPLITNMVSGILERIYGRLLGNVGRLAARNMRDNRNTSQNITLLFISISAVIAITVVGDFVTAYVGDVFRGAELQGFADGRMEPEFVEEVGRMEGIDRVLPLYVYQNRIQADGITLNRLEGTGRLDWYGPMLAVRYTKQDMEARAAAVFRTERVILLSEACLERTGFSVGDTLTLTDGGGQYEYQVIGSFKSRATDVEAVISSAFAETDFGASDYGFLAFTAADPEAVMARIRDLFGDTWNWSRTVEEFNADALATVGAFLQPMHTMTYFILLLAAVGVVNNLLINYIQRRQSIAMYKCVGLSNRQNMKMLLLEGFSSGLTGAVIAVCISYMEIRTIFLVAGPRISMAPELKVGPFLAAGVMGIAVTLTGSAVPVWKCRNMKLVEEIKFE